MSLSVKTTTDDVPHLTPLNVATNPVSDSKSQSQGDSSSISKVIAILKLLNFVVFTILAIASLASEYSFFSRYHFVSMNPQRCSPASSTVGPSPTHTYRFEPVVPQGASDRDKFSAQVRLWVPNDVLSNFTRKRAPPSAPPGPGSSQHFVFGFSPDMIVVTNYTDMWPSEFNQHQSSAILGGDENSPEAAETALYALLGYFSAKLIGGILAHVTTLYVVFSSLKLQLKETLSPLPICCGRCHIRIQHVWFSIVSILSMLTLFPLSFASSWSYDRTPYNIRPYIGLNTTTATTCNALLSYKTMFRGDDPYLSHVEKAGAAITQVHVMFNAGGGASGIVLIYPVVCTCLGIFIIVGNMLQCHRVKNLKHRDGDEDSETKPALMKSMTATKSDKALTWVLWLSISATCACIVMFVQYIGLYLGGPDLENFFTLSIGDWFNIPSLELDGLGAIASTEIVMNVLLSAVDSIAAYVYVRRRLNACE
jgi:hypothetical protein